MNEAARLEAVRLRDDGSAGSSPQPKLLSSAMSVVIATTARTALSSGCNGAEFRLLRRTCRELRGVYDRVAVREICLGSCRRSYGWQPPLPDAVESTIRGLLVRGCKPTSVSLEVPCSTPHPDSSEQTVLALLRALAAGEAPISRLTLGAHTPVSEAVARAVAGVSPALTHLNYWFCVHRPAASADAPGDTACSQASSEQSLAAALQLLHQLAGPRLQDLTLNTNSLSWPSPAANPLPYCTGLTRLVMHCNLAAAGHKDGGLAAESALLRALPSLANLRDLSISVGAEPPSDSVVRQARAALLESCLAPLTALTRLKMSIGCLGHVYEHMIEYGKADTLYGQIAELRSAGRHDAAALLESAAAAEWRALAAAARCMPQLRELHTPAIGNVADLEVLTALTSLAVGALELPKEPPCPYTASATQQELDGGGLATMMTMVYQEPPPRRVYALPPLLKELTVNAPLPLDVAAALRRSSAAAAAAAVVAASAAPAAAAAAGVSLRASMMFWSRDNKQCWGLEFSARGVNYLEQEGRLVARAVQDLHGAADSLKDAFWPLQPPPAMMPLDPSPSASQPSSAGAPSGAVHQQQAQASSRLYLVVSSGGARVLPPEGGTHCGSWLGPLVDSLRPRPLQGLKISGFAMSPRDMLGVGRCMQGITILNFRGCSYSLFSVPLLGGMKALRELYLCSDDWGMIPLEDRLRPSDVEAAFLSLFAPLSSGDIGGGGLLLAAADPQQQAASESGGGGSSSREEEHVAPAAAEVVEATAALLPLPDFQILEIDCCRDEDVEWLQEALASVRDELGLRPRPADLDIRYRD